MRAEHEIQNRKNPQASLTAAITHADRAIALDPLGSASYNNRGNAFLTLAEYQIGAGTDPGEALNEAAASYRRAGELRPGYALALYNLGLTERYRADALLHAHRDPLAAVEAASTALTAAATSDPGDADIHLERARVQLIAARWARLNGNDAGDEIARALQDAAVGLALNPSNAELHAVTAETQLLQAEAPGRSERQRQRDRDAAAAAVEEALRVNPTLAEALKVARALGREEGGHSR